MAQATAHTTTTTTPEGNVALVRRFYELLAAGDMGALRAEILAPDIRWRIPGRNPLAGEKRGVDEVLAWVGLLGRTTYKMDLVYLEGNGEYVVEIHHGHGEYGGVAVDCSNSAIYTVKDGRIADVQNHTSDQYGLDAYYGAIFQYAPLPQRLAR